MVVVVKGKEARHVAVVGAGACLGVAHESAVIFALQLHVHHVVLALHVVPDHLALSGRLVIDLQFLHGEVGQIVEHHFVLTAEEVLAVQHQVVHLATVDVDVAIVLQLGPLHLTDEPVEHRALGQVEGIGIESDGVATIE